MLDSFKCLTYPEKNLDYSTPSPVDNTNITNGSSSSESNSYLGLKTSREEQKSMESSRGDVPWTFEEEYLFFEAHKLLKNKWTKYSSYFPQFCKEMKEFKNHFHACIIKTVRRSLETSRSVRLKVKCAREGVKTFDLVSIEEMNQRPRFPVYVCSECGHSYGYRKPKSKSCIICETPFKFEDTSFF